MSKYLLALTIIFCIPFSIVGENHTTELLPDTTLLYWEMDNGKEFCQQMREIGIWQLFTSEEWKAFFNTIPSEIIDLVLNQQKGLEAQFGLTTENILQSFSGHLSLAVTDIVTGDMILPVVVLNWDMGTQKENYANLLANMLPNIVGKVETYQYNDYTIYIVPTPAMPAYYTYVGSTLRVSNNKEELEQSLNGARDYNLASNKNYQDVKNNTLRNRSGALLYLNTQKIIDFAIQFEGEGVVPIVEMIGLKNIQAIGAGLYFNNEQIVESLYLHMPGKRSGILADVIPAVPVSTKLESFIPDGLIGFRHGYLDLEGLLNVGLRYLEQSAPPQYDEFLGLEAEYNQQLGINIRKDIIGNLGKEYLTSVSFSGGLLPDVSFQITIKDEDTMRKALQQLFTKVPEKHRYSFLWNGYTFDYFNYSTMENPVPIAPTFVIADGRLLVTLYPEMAKNLISQKNGSFPKEVRTYLNGRKHTDLQYFNIEKLIVPLYRTALPFIQSMIPRSEVPIEFGLLPAANTLDRYLHNAVLVSFADAQGMCIETHSPFGFTPMIVGLGVIGYFTESKRSEPPKIYDEIPEVDVKDDSNENNNIVDNSEALEANLLSVTEQRTWKSSDPDLTAQLKNVWISESNIKLRTFAPFPENTIGYGNFKFDETADNLGNPLKHKPGFGFGYNKYAKLNNYELKDLVKKKGFFFDLEFSAPARDSQSVNIKGSFEIKMAEFKTLEVPNYGDLCKNLSEVNDIKDMKIQFTKECKDKSICLNIEGDALRINNIHALDGETKIESNGWSSYPSKDAIVATYWFSKAIPDTASVVIEYADNLQTKKILINIENQELP